MNANKLLLEVISAVVTVHLVTACDSGWTASGGSCYLFGSIKVDFLTAQDFCIQKSANLVHINDATENTFIKSTVKAMSAISWWLGLDDMDAEGKFQWIDDKSTPVFTDWHPGQPNNYNSNEDCATLYKNYNFTWSDYYCERQVASPICEKPDSASG